MNDIHYKLVLCQLVLIAGADLELHAEQHNSTSFIKW